MSCIKLNSEHKNRLLRFAAQCVEHGLQFQQPLPVDLDEVPPLLLQPAATFVTLNFRGQLAGCIGSLQATQRLLEDVLHNAYSAAFADRRFEPLQQSMLPELEIEIAVLSELSELSELSPADTVSEQALMALLVPGEHGLVLEYEGRRATFLPKVWAMLPDKSEFVVKLKEKAGLSADFWSPQIHCSLYTVDSFSNL